jgi:uncharacterized protein (DUF885 family)
MSEHADFDALIDEFYPVWFRYHPDIALSLGVSGFETRLPAAEDDAVGALGAWLENLVLALGEIDYDALDRARQLDFRLLLEAAQVEYQELLMRDWRYLDPTRFLPIQEIFQLTLHPPDELGDTLVALLRAVPEYLRQARVQLMEYPQLIAPQMVEVAMDEADIGIAYLDALAGSVWLRHHCRSCTSIHPAVDDAVLAIETYVECLSQDIAPKAQGSLGCGEEHFRRLLERRHFLTIPLSGLDTYLQAVYQDTFRQLAAHAQLMGIAGQPGFVMAFLQRQESFTGEKRIQVYREEATRLKKFIREQGFLTLPEQPFRIIERPVCPRPEQCDSGYLQEPDRQGGIFFISGHSGDDVGGEPRSVIRSHCIRQGWTGAHLLTFGTGGSARDLPRRLAPAASFAMAWDLYFRQFLLGSGFCAQQDRLVQLLHQLQAIKLALLDLHLNLGKISSAQALEQLSELELGPLEANRRLIALARAPTDYLAGVVGWLLIHQARVWLQRQEGFSIGDFNDQLLSQGPVPPALLLPHLFGDELWGKVKDELDV